MKLQATFKALSDPTRRKIIALLQNGPMQVQEIVDQFQTSNATISHHLSTLKKAGLIIDEKQGKYIYYELNASVIDEVIGWISSLRKEG